MIFKPKIKKVLQSILVIFTALICALTINTLQTYADDTYTKWAKSIVDSEGFSTAGETGKVRFGVSYQKTGYLCYLLDKNGSRAADKVVLFQVRI